MWRMRRKRNPRKRIAADRRIRPEILYGILSLCIFFVVLLLIYTGTRRETVTLRNLDISGGMTIPHETIENITHETLNGSYAGIVPYTFTYLYPKERIENAIKSIPRVKDVTIQRISRTALHIEYTEYEPWGLLCGSDSDKDCFFISVDGYAFVRAPTLTGGSLLRFVEEGVTIQQGDRVSADVLFRTNELRDELDEKLSLRVNTIEITKDGDIHFILNKGGSILLPSEFDNEKVMRDLQVLLSSPEYKHLKPGTFLYIDMRFGSKIFINEGKTNESDESTDSKSL